MKVTPRSLYIALTMKKSAEECAEETHSSSEGPSVSRNKMFQLKHKNPYSKDTTKPVLFCCRMMQGTQTLSLENWDQR